MAEDQLYQEANEDLSDKILDIGSDAAAFGIAAASFYRADGARFISKRMREYSHSNLKSAINNFRKLNYDKININTLRKSTDEITEALRHFKVKPHDNTIKIDTQTGFGSFLVAANRLMKKAEKPGDGRVSELMWMNHVLKTVTNHAIKLGNAAGVNKAEMENMKMFAASMARQTKRKDLNDFSLGLLMRNADKTGKFFKQYASIVQEALKVNKQYAEALKTNKVKIAKEKRVENQLLDKMLDINTLLKRYSPTRSQKIIDTIGGDRAVTVGDILDNPKKYNNVAGALSRDADTNSVHEDSVISILQELSKRYKKEELSKFRSLVVDPYLRTDGIDVYSLSSIRSMKNDIIKTAANSMPGKILKLRDMDMSASIPDFFKISKFSISPVIAALEKGNTTNRVQSDYYYIAGSVYRYDDELFSLSKDPIKELENATIISTRYGGAANLHRDIMGLGAQRMNEPGFFSMFGLNSSPSMNIWEEITGIFKHDDDYIPNIVNEISKTTDPIDKYKRLQKLNIHLNERIRPLTLSELDAIEKTGMARPGGEKDIGSLEILKILQETDDEKVFESVKALQGSMDGVDSSYYNTGMSELLRRLVSDQNKTLSSVKLMQDTTEAMSSGAYEGKNFAWQLRHELSQELMIRLAVENNDGSGAFTTIKNIIENSNMSKAEEDKVKSLSYISLINYVTEGIFKKEGYRNLAGGDLPDGIADAIISNSADSDMLLHPEKFTNEIVSRSVDFYTKLLNSKTADEGLADASKTIKDIVGDSFSLNSLHPKMRDTSGDLQAQYISSDYAFLRDSAGPLSIIKSINESIEAHSMSPFIDKTTEFFKQLFAGRDNAQDVSAMTMIPYFFLRRLGADDLPPFLRFSNDELSSTPNLIKALTKRIAPVAIAGTYLEWADDTVGAITGTRASAGFINALDYMDIGTRKLLDMFGIGSYLNEESYINPAMQYWFGKDGYYDADQERDNIANGYEPVRRGRWWSFGSVNEFRGSSIEYYRPNLTRRLNSDYYNKSLYDGYWDKWSHSLLPTPANPLSPLFYALDPYYLENEHKYDRPYLLSAPMFSENTPWGIVLNPTIGEFIKPQKRMNQDRITDDGQDVYALIYQMNKHIRDTAQGDHAYALVFDREQITAGEYTSYASPALGQYNIKIGRSKGENDRYIRNRAIGGSDVERRTMLYSGSGSYGGGGEGGGSSFGGIVSGGSGDGNGTYPLDMLGQTNRQIYAAAARNTNTGGMITGDYIRHSVIEDALEREDINDLLQSGQGADLVSQAATSLRLISGIYGYGANKFAGFAESKPHIADAGDIDSFSRSFWDESIGGIGGGAAEIARRFIPEYRRRERINPLLNNLPDWLPENLRMGDAFSNTPFGEARLPGKGYEALNKLHPDAYGIYGSYDRFKILADVAPNSTEFKIWKKIANATVKDASLKADMKKIQQRVNEHNKTHDFYPYKIIGHGVDYQNVTVSEVNNDGTFRIKGSNELYAVAGLDFTARTRVWENQQGIQSAGSTLEMMKQHVFPGQNIVIAVDSNKYYAHNPDGDNTVNAAVFIDGESLAQTLLHDHPDLVSRKTENTNAADTVAMTTTTQRVIGGIAELVSHADLPWIHDKFLRVRDPLESYNAEQVYGTPYQTWSDILGTYLQPAWERAISDPYANVRGTIEWFGLNNLKQRQGIGKGKKFALSAASVFLDRGAFIGGTISKIIFPNSGKAFERGSKLGLALSMAGSVYTSTQNSPLQSAAVFGTAGWIAGDMLDTEKEKFTKEAEGSIKKFFRNEKSFSFRLKGALAGAAIGAAAYGVISSVEGEDHWIPDRVKKKWELEDYFDRLTYIKYMGLYHKAAEKAKSEEGTDIEKIFSDYEKWSKERREIMYDSDVNNPDFLPRAKITLHRMMDGLKKQVFGNDDGQNHRFEYANGMSINDLPGVRNGVFHSEELTPEERLYTLNALVTMGIKYNKPGTSRVQDDRNMTALTEFERVYHTKIPKYYEVHHIVEFSQNGPDDPSNMIALHPDDHLYITEQQHNLARGDFEAAQIGARTALKLGEYGRSALLYKKAAEATMYGLRADARWTDVVKSLPKYERDYFVEFMKERDPDKQQEILKSVSPFLRRALKQVWQMDYTDDKGPDNEEYFEHHNLPNFMWEGWDPGSDLNKVKAKTIKNEGMLFSDFGIYESTYRDQEVINAPNLSPKGSGNPITVQTNLAATLSGLGLTGVEVSVSPKSTSGIQSVINLTKVVNYKISQAVDGLF